MRIDILTLNTIPFLLALFSMLTVSFTVKAESQVVATVNGIPITKSRLDVAVAAYIAKTGQPAVNQDERKKLLKRIVRHELILSHDGVDALRRDEEIVRRVKDYESDLVIKKFFQNRIGAQVTVSEKEIKEYYQQNLSRFSSPPKVEARHILLRDLDTAQEVASGLKRGEDFGQLAKEFSIDLPSASKGGKLGTVQKGRATLPEVEKALFTVSEGEVSDIVKTKYGYHIFVVDKRIARQFKPLEEVSDLIRRILLQQKQAKAFDELASELEKNAEIKIFDNRLSDADP